MLCEFCGGEHEHQEEFACLITTEEERIEQEMEHNLFLLLSNLSVWCFFRGTTEENRFLTFCLETKNKVINAMLSLAKKRDKARWQAWQKETVDRLFDE